jgi:hypothetical protein
MLMTVKNGTETEKALIMVSRNGLSKILSARNPAPRKSRI